MPKKHLKDPAKTLTSEITAFKLTQFLNSLNERVTQLEKQMVIVRSLLSKIDKILVGGT